MQNVERQGSREPSLAGTPLFGGSAKFIPDTGCQLELLQRYGLLIWPRF